MNTVIIISANAEWRVVVKENKPRDKSRGTEKLRKMS